MSQQSTSARSIPSPLKCRLEQLRRLCSPQENLELLPGHLRECQGVRLSGGLGDCSHYYAGPFGVSVCRGRDRSSSAWSSASSRFPLQISHPYLVLEWHGQVQPGKLQSPCLVSYVAFSLQKDEIIGGKTPSGYPGKELSVGSGNVSG